MSPLNLSATLGHNNFIFLLIGFGFGVALEVSGFGDSRKLAAQFYFYEMRVFKVMFTAIVTAMILVFLTSSLGLLDLHKVFVNPTYLVPGIVGGFVMGIGFIVGGFCPGTSIVGASTLKLDAIFFLIGVFFGVFLFGESVPYFESFYHSSFYGRYTLSDLFNLDAGWVVLGVFVMAVGFFLLAEKGEAQFEPAVYHNQGAALSSRNQLVRGLALLGFFLILVTVFLKQPNTETRWGWISQKEEAALENRDYYIHPGELRDLIINPEIYLKIIDLRSESDFNIFHLEDSQRMDLNQLDNDSYLKELLNAPSNTVFVLVSNNEQLSTQAWKILKAQDILNAYILEGGLNHWLQVFPLNPVLAQPVAEKNSENLAFQFMRSLGSQEYSSFPYDPVHEDKNIKMTYPKKVKLQAKSVVKGGCG